ncbi:MAG: hypothetical protein FWB80_14485 [Defluviitaleaceae bacterium]|nr:hypothetical protein [Defluviitaleaceae bacterium]
MTKFFLFGIGVISFLLNFIYSFSIHLIPRSWSNDGIDYILFIIIGIVLLGMFLWHGFCYTKTLTNFLTIISIVLLSALTFSSWEAHSRGYIRVREAFIPWNLYNRYFEIPRWIELLGFGVLPWVYFGVFIIVLAIFMFDLVEKFELPEPRPRPRRYYDDEGYKLGNN